ncbi:heme exporter protein CcmD [Marinobacter sp.]|uniref:heme exporter protein CcmD n=1 Tax=Marinobacter sp. TaxID=50741 RepID=UPI0035623898
MAFDSFNAFILMEGHGPYVWTCYGVFFLLVAVIAWLSVRDRRRVVLSQQQEQARATSPGVSASTRDRTGGFQRIPTTQSESTSKS